ncbi:MAG TPA: PLP-dependent aminotransferase family protein [Selenomonadales bacterium]|nr:PLP-dependent aminotransferase family protein [Selenomonadales bacterium]
MSTKTGAVAIDWKPDPASKVPVYKQIVSFISRKISSGDWLVGYKLPAQREMAKLFNVNRSTVVEALEELKAQGLIEGNFGQGTQIVNNTWSLMISTPPTNWQSYISSGIHQANLPTVQVINKQEFMAGITRLSTGEISPDLFPYDMMQKVLCKLPERVHSLSYIEPLGLPELRKTLSRYLEKYGLKVSPSNLLIVSGSLQALQLISIGLLQPGSTVFVETPSYIKSLHVFQSAGMKLAGVPMDDRGLLPAMLSRKKSSRGTALLYTIPTFHNPTGTVMTEDRRRELLEWCAGNRLPMIEDDAYRELWLDEPPPLPMKARDQSGTVLYTGTVSKTLAAGLRLGWLAGPEPVVERLGDVKMQTDYGTSSLSQWALTEWIESGLYDEHLAILRKRLKERREYVLRVLEGCFKGLAAWNTPAGGFYIWLRLPDGVPTEKLFHLALAEKLLINPGSLYDFAKNPYIRISYAFAPLAALDRGLVRLAELVRSLQ